MKIERTVVYCPDDIVQEARKKGLTNLSGFFREKLIEYNTGAPTARSNAPVTTTNGGE